MCMCSFVVGKAPKIIEPLLDMEVSAPEEVFLECDIDAGDPKATIHWYKENKEVYAGNKYSMTYKDSVATLVLNQSGINDSGWYRCEAANKVGRVETRCTLIVQSKFALSVETQHIL